MYLVAATSMIEVRCRVLFYSDYYSMYLVPATSMIEVRCRVLFYSEYHSMYLVAATSMMGVRCSAGYCSIVIIILCTWWPPHL